MKILKNENPEKDILQITRKEFKEKGIDFIFHNGFIESLRECGNPETVALEQIKDTVLFSEFEELLFGKEDE